MLHYDIRIVFVPEKRLFLADMLSWTLDNCENVKSDSEKAEVHAMSVISSCVSHRILMQLVVKTSKAEYLSSVLKSLGRGELEGQLKPFTGELSQVQEDLLKGCKVTIPASMKRKILEKIRLDP